MSELARPNSEEVNDTLMPAIGSERPDFRSSNIRGVSAPVFMLSMTPLIEWTVSQQAPEGAEQAEEHQADRSDSG